MKGLFGLKSALVMVVLAVATFALLRSRANRSAGATQPVEHYPSVEDRDEGVLQQLRADAIQPVAHYASVEDSGEGASWQLRAEPIEPGAHYSSVEDSDEGVLQQLRAEAIEPVAHYPSIEDSEESVLQQLRADGSDLTKKTDIVNYLYIPSLKDAEQIAEHLSRAGYEVEVREPQRRLTDGEIESRYSVLIHITEKPSIDNIRRIRHLMDQLAQRFNGDYDGWETRVQQ
jgi:regulator of RNase E activity RraB